MGINSAHLDSRFSALLWLIESTTHNRVLIMQYTPGQNRSKMSVLMSAGSGHYCVHVI